MRIAINSKTLPNTKAAIVKMYQNGTKLALSSQTQTAAVVLAQYIYINKATKVFTFQLGKGEKNNQLLLLTISSKEPNEINNHKKSTHQLKWVSATLAKVEFGILFQIYQKRLSSQQTLDGTNKANIKIKVTDFRNQQTPQAKLAQEAIQKLVAADFTTGINKNKIAELGQPNQDNVVADIRKKINNIDAQALILPSDITITTNDLVKTVTIIISNHGPDKTITISGFLSIKDYLDQTYNLNQILTNIPSLGGALTIPEGITSSQFHAYVEAMGVVSDADGLFVMNKFAKKYQSKITSIILPNSFTTISNWFAHFDKISSLTIPNSVTSIGEKAFYKAKLISLRIPDSVTSIGEKAFRFSPLKSLTLSNQLQTIGKFAFRNAQLTSLKIPNSVTSIGKTAFAFSPLKSLTLSNHLQAIGESAFHDAELTSLTIPNSVISIGHRAFYKAKLTSLTIPNSVISIEYRAFYEAQLTSLTIPNSVTSIGSEAFSSSPLESLTLSNQLQTIGSETFYKAKLISLRIPNSVTSIGKSAFSSSPLESLTLSNQLQTIGESAFYDAKLTSLKIPNSVTSIGDNAFSSSPIPTIDIFNGVSIGNNAFSEATTIKRIPRPT